MSASGTREILDECERRDIFLTFIDTVIPGRIEFIWHGKRIEVRGYGDGRPAFGILDVLALFPEKA